VFSVNHIAQLLYGTLLVGSGLPGGSATTEKFGELLFGDGVVTIKMFLELHW
jgi:hypothetical protein